MLCNKLILLKTNVVHGKALGLEHYIRLKMLVLVSLPILVMTAKKYYKHRQLMQLLR